MKYTISDGVSSFVGRGDKEGNAVLVDNVFDSILFDCCDDAQNKLNVLKSKENGFEGFEVCEVITHVIHPYNDVVGTIYNVVYELDDCLENGGLYYSERKAKNRTKTISSDFGGDKGFNGSNIDEIDITF